MGTQTEYFSAVAEDVIRVAKLEPKAFDSAIEALRASSSFLSIDQALELISSHVKNDKAANAIRNLVFALHEWVNESEVDVVPLCEELKSAVRSARNSEIKFDEVRFLECLTILAGPFPALQRQANAERVANLAGNRASSISFVNDLRPVYRQPDRDQIEGMIPLTTMVVDAVNPMGGRTHLELVLSVSELEELTKQANRAKEKLAQLIELAQDSGKPVPDIGLTRNAARDEVTQ